MNAPLTTHPTPPYKHTPLFPLGKDTTPYRKIADGVRVEKVMGQDVLVVPREAIRALSEAAFTDINHLLAPRCTLRASSTSSRTRRRRITTSSSPTISSRTPNIAAGGVLPMCRQDTGTAIIMGKKGRLVWTDGDDEAALAEGARDAYFRRNLRYSQLAPISMFEEKNTRSNMPAQVEIYAEGARRCRGGLQVFVHRQGRRLGQQGVPVLQATPSILTHDRTCWRSWKEKVLTLGTAACPPYHLAIVIGGTSGRTDHEDREARFGPNITTTCPTTARKTDTRSATRRWSRKSSR